MELCSLCNHANSVVNVNAATVVALMLLLLLLLFLFAILLFFCSIVLLLLLLLLSLVVLLFVKMHCNMLHTSTLKHNVKYIVVTLYNMFMAMNTTGVLLSLFVFDILVQIVHLRLFSALLLSTFSHEKSTFFLCPLGLEPSAWHDWETHWGLATNISSGAQVCRIRWLHCASSDCSWVGYFDQNVVFNLFGNLLTSTVFYSDPVTLMMKLDWSTLLTGVYIIVP